MTTQEFLNDVNVIVRCCEDTKAATDSSVRATMAESVAYNQIKRRFEELKDELRSKDSMVF